MDLALKNAKKSGDPSTKVGAVIVKNGKVIANGANNFPLNLNHSKQLSWDNKSKDWIETKYPYVVHAEMNAYADANKKKQSINGATIYVTLYPCNECAKNLIQAGIKEIIYKDDIHHDQPAFVASRRLLKIAKIKIRQYK